MNRVNQSYNDMAGPHLDLVLFLKMICNVHNVDQIYKELYTSLQMQPIILQVLKILAFNYENAHQSCPNV
jgi:hypothetical protein